MQQISRPARINKDSMHIKIVNTQSKYKGVIMRSDDLGRVYRWKGYGAVNRLNCCVALRGTDSVYPGSDCGCTEHFSSLSFGLVLVIGRASQYEVDGALGFRWVLDTSNCPVGSGGSFCSAGRLLDVYSKVPCPYQFLYQEL